MRITILVFLIISFSEIAIAQDSRTVAPINNSSPRVYSAEELALIREVLIEHPYTKYYDRLIVEYEERMKANIKKYQVMARKMQKPQYSDPLYFGHKKKPKKRPVGKRKYCKECEIVH